MYDGVNGKTEPVEDGRMQDPLALWKAQVWLQAEGVL